MAKLPLVAIIGRPNTGKSTLFNGLVRERIAIESAVAGTTRDHITRRVRAQDMDYLLIDTGGMGGGTEDEDFEDDVHAQSLLALEAADLILFTVNAREEVTKSDLQVAELLRKRRRRHVPVLLVINKCDTPDVAESSRHSFHKLGLSENILPVSAAHRIGFPELQASIAAHLKALHFTKAPDVERTPDAATPRVAIVGKPNVGKSSLLNALMSPEQRSVSPKLVSDVAGTTRDSTDTIVRHEEKEYIFVDTAGLRRPARIEEDLEGLAVLRSLQAIEEADVVLLVIDALEPVSQQDKRIAQKIIEAGKGIILVINKIDLMKGEERIERTAEVRGNFLFCRYAPILPLSAIEKQGVLKLFPLVNMVHENRLRRLETRDLRRFFEDAVLGKPMSSLATAKHITQAADPPPTFVLFVRRPTDVQISQLRYLENRLRETFGLDGTPVKWILKRPSDRKDNS